MPCSFSQRTSVVGAFAKTSMERPRSWYSPDAVRKISLVSSSSSTKSRVSSSTSRLLQRRSSPRDLKKRMVSNRSLYVSPETGKLLRQGQHWREKVAVAADALEHLVLLELQ